MACFLLALQKFAQRVLKYGFTSYLILAIFKWKWTETWRKKVEGTNLLDLQLLPILSLSFVYACFHHGFLYFFLYENCLESELYHNIQSDSTQKNLKRGSIPRDGKETVIVWVPNSLPSTTSTVTALVLWLLSFYIGSTNVFYYWWKRFRLCFLLVDPSVPDLVVKVTWICKMFSFLWKAEMRMVRILWTYNVLNGQHSQCEGMSGVEGLQNCRVRYERKEVWMGTFEILE